MGTPSFEKAITFVLMSTFPAFALPLRDESSRLKVIFYKTMTYFGFCNHMMVASAQLYTSYNHYDNQRLLTPCLMLTCACLCGNVQLVACKMQSKRLKVILDALEECAVSKDPLVVRIVQEYIERYKTFYIIFVGWVYFTATTFVLTPLVSEQPLPTPAEYPLPMEDPRVRCMLYMQQILASYQCAGQISLNAFCALVYIFITAKFDVLKENFSVHEGLEEQKKCIKEHEYLMWLAEEIIAATRFIVAAELVFGTLRIVTSALTFFNPNTLASEKGQYLVVNSTTLYSTFASIWPADSFLYLNDKIREACYDSGWWEQTLSMKKNILTVMFRCQKNLSVSVGCILSAASLEYYLAYVYTAVSYITVFRVLLSEEDE